MSESGSGSGEYYSQDDGLSEIKNFKSKFQTTSSIPTNMSETTDIITVILSPSNPPVGNSATSDFAFLFLVIFLISIVTVISSCIMISVMRRIVYGFKQLPALAEERPHDYSRITKTHQLLKLRNEVKKGIKNANRSTDAENKLFRLAIAKEKKGWKNLKKLRNCTNQYEIQSSIYSQMNYLRIHKKSLLDIHHAKGLVLKALKVEFSQSIESIKSVRNHLDILAVGKLKNKSIRPNTMAHNKFNGYSKHFDTFTGVIRLDTRNDIRKAFGNMPKSITKSGHNCQHKIVESRCQHLCLYNSIKKQAVCTKTAVELANEAFQYINAAKKRVREIKERAITYKYKKSVRNLTNLTKKYEFETLKKRNNRNYDIDDDLFIESIPRYIPDKTPKRPRPYFKSNISPEPSSSSSRKRYKYVPNRIPTEREPSLIRNETIEFTRVRSRVRFNEFSGNLDSNSNMRNTLNRLTRPEINRSLSKASSTSVEKKTKKTIEETTTKRVIHTETVSQHNFHLPMNEIARQF